MRIKNRLILGQEHRKSHPVLFYELLHQIIGLLQIDADQLEIFSSMLLVKTLKIGHGLLAVRTPCGEKGQEDRFFTKNRGQLIFGAFADNGQHQVDSGIA